MLLGDSSYSKTHKNESMHTFRQETTTLKFYYIKSSEIQENIDDIYFIFSCHRNVHINFWITSDFSIDLQQCTSELQTPITFLFVNENIKCGYSFS